MIKVALIGVGRMGSLAARNLVEEGYELVSAFTMPGDSVIGKDVGRLAGLDELGVKVSSSRDLRRVLDETKPDVVVDFTVADAFMENLKTVAGRKINLVVGTTGFNDKQLSEIKKTVKENKVGMVLSPNMSVGVNVFWNLCKEAARNLGGYDIEVVEKHHKFKKDAPSGTALKTAEVIAETLGLSRKNFVYGRHGKSLRGGKEIGIHAVRAGSIVGEHTVIFASQNEVVELKHVAQSREAFASGVPKAIEFIKGRKGFYGMDDVLGLKKD